VNFIAANLRAAFVSDNRKRSLTVPETEILSSAPPLPSSCLLTSHSTLTESNNVTTATMADRDLTEDEVADLKEAFAMFDINGDGR
jgi:hypothetical protein